MLNSNSLVLNDVIFPQTINLNDSVVAGPGKGVLFLKRMIDVTGALIGILLFGWLMFVIAIAVKLTSKGPILFRQQRVGYNGELFEVIKFRTMHVNAEAKTGAVWADEGPGKVDPRVTPIGNFLRKSHLDELPQLFLILSGVMSIVGPRPERPEFVNKLDKEYAFYHERVTNLKPGLSGIAQMHREVDEGFKDTDTKLISDHSYGILLNTVNTWEFLVLEMRIIMGTVLNIIHK